MNTRELVKMQRQPPRGGSVGDIVKVDVDNNEVMDRMKYVNR